MVAASRLLSASLFVEYPSGIAKRIYTAAIFAIVPAVLMIAVRSAVGQTAHYSGVQRTVISNSGYPSSIAFDRQGNLYFTDDQNGLVEEILAVGGKIPASPAVFTLGSGFLGPRALAVDGSGNVYFSESGRGLINEMLAVNGSVPPSPVIRAARGNLADPQQVALDGSGNLVFTGGCEAYAIGQQPGDPCGFVGELLAVNGSLPAASLETDSSENFAGPQAITADNSGNIYAADATGTVYEILAINGTLSPYSTIRTIYKFVPSVFALTLDASGDLFATTYPGNSLYEIPAVNGVIPPTPTAVTIASGFYVPAGVGVDGSGNIYVADAYNNRIVVLSASGGNFGQINIGTTSKSIPLTFTFDTGGTLGSTAVLTQGAAGLDFVDAGGDTCAANTVYSAGQSCTVNVMFTPRLPGLRAGAAVLKDVSGNVIATGYVKGIGVGPQVAFGPGQQSIFSSGQIWDEGIATDAGGNVYVSSSSQNAVYKETPVGGGSYVQSQLPTSPLYEPMGLAVDGSGAVYIVDTGHWRILKETPSAASYSETTVASFPAVDGSAPMAVAVDGDANVYVVISDGTLYKETPTAGAYVQSTIPTGLTSSSGVAVDGSGNLYIVENADIGAIVKLTLVGGSYVRSTIPLPPNGVPTGITVDAAGDLYVTFIEDRDTGDIYREAPTPNGYVQTSVPVYDLNQPFALALDGSGNLFIADSGPGNVVKVDLADAPNLWFANTRVGSNSSDSPQTVTVANIGNAPLSFPVPATGYNPSVSSNFSWNDSDSSSCPVVGIGSSAAGLLAAGATCDLPISFTPTTTGTLNGTMVLTDNHLNAAGPGYAVQSIVLGGTGTANGAVVTWPTPAPITYGTALSKTQLDATASVAGSFSYSPSSGTKLSAGTQTLTVTFTPKSSSYGSVKTTVTLLVNQATPKVSWSTPKAITYGTVLSSTQLNATANVAGTMTYSPAAGTTPSVGTDTLTVTFVPTDSTDYTTATATVKLTVNAAPSFTLSASPSSVSINPGSSGTSTIAVTVLSGSVGKVSLSALHLPTGVTASFSSNPTSTTSKLTLKASKTASAGTSTITIAGTAGSVQASTTISLTVL